MFELKLRKIGKSIGVVLPQEVLARLSVREGDAICLTEGVDGSLRITRSSTEFKKQMEVAEGISRRYAKALRDLAK